VAVSNVSGRQVTDAVSRPATCSYIHTAAYGHFGRTDKPEVFTWEKVLPLKDA
jgi:S-adenosylmethionine synthetase